MSIKRRRLPILLGATTAVAAALMVGSPAAVAAPTVPSGTLTLTCPGLGTFDVVTPPTSENADFTPAFVAATHQVFIPYQLSGTITVTFGPTEPLRVIVISFLSASRSTRASSRTGAR